MKAPFTLHAGDNAEEHQPHDDDDDAEHSIDRLLVLQQDRSDAAERDAVRDEDDAEAENEEQAAEQHPAAAPGRVGKLSPCEARDVGDVAGGEGKDAR